MRLCRGARLGLAGRSAFVAAVEGGMPLWVAAAVFKGLAGGRAPLAGSGAGTRGEPCLSLRPSGAGRMPLPGLLSAPGLVVGPWARPVMSVGVVQRVCGSWGAWVGWFRAGVAAPWWFLLFLGFRRLCGLAVVVCVVGGSMSVGSWLGRPAGWWSSSGSTASAGMGSWFCVAGSVSASMCSVAALLVGGFLCLRLGAGRLKAGGSRACP